MDILDAFISVAGAMTTFYSILFCSLHNKFSEQLAVHTEEVDYVVNGKVIKKETWVVQKWSR